MLSCHSCGSGHMLIRMAQNGLSCQTTGKRTCGVTDSSLTGLCRCTTAWHSLAAMGPCRTPSNSDWEKMQRSVQDWGEWWKVTLSHITAEVWLELVCCLSGWGNMRSYCALRESKRSAVLCGPTVAWWSTIPCKPIAAQIATFTPVLHGTSTVFFVQWCSCLCNIFGPNWTQLQLCR